MQWAISHLETLPESQGHQNVVYAAHWFLTLAEEDRISQTAGTAYFMYNSEVEFIPFEELTEETLIGWVKNYLGAERVQNYENSVIMKNEEQKNSTPVDPDPPVA